MARQKLKPEFDAESVKSDLIETVCDSYRNGVSVRALAKKFELSPMKTRKILITGGVYSTDISKAKAAAEKVEEAVAAEEIEAKKTTRAAGRKAKAVAEDTKAAAKAATKSKPKAKKAEYILQSAFGHELVVEEIAAKIPEDVEKVYIRIDQNKLHFVREDGSTGSVDIW